MLAGHQGIDPKSTPYQDSLGRITHHESFWKVPRMTHDLVTSGWVLQTTHEWVVNRYD